MSHTINSHVLTDTSLCIDKAIHALLIHSFVALHSGAVTKSEATSSNVHSSELNFVTSAFALEAAFLNRSQVTYLSAPL